MFTERQAIEKRMDQIFRANRMLQEEYDRLFQRLRELDLMISKKEVPSQEPYPVRVVSVEPIVAVEEWKSETTREDEEENIEIQQKRCSYDEVLPEVVRILKEAPIPVRSSLLREKLEEANCGVTQKNFTSFMNELMKKDNRIARPNRGFYEYNSNLN